ncbi:methyltransferase RsmF C-terminal domain-like protein, partial [Xylanibacter rodentium]
AVEEWSPQNVDACSRLQREIVADAWQCLRPGGLLIYSTCTFNATENEENIRWIVDELGGMPVAVPVSEGWGICGSLLADFTAPVYRFIPGCTRGEGLFMAVLRKSPDAESPIILRKGKRYVQDKYDNGNKKRKDKAIAASLVSRDIEKIVSGWTSFVSGDEHIEPALRQSDVCVLALTPHLARLYDAASLSLRVLSAGVTLGNVKGHDIVPNHSLALSSVLCPDAFPVVPLTYTQAVAYLRRETVALPPDTPMGFVLVAWHDAVLGFVKNIGNRANNLYPQEWKIKSTHVPDREPWVLV